MLVGSNAHRGPHRIRAWMPSLAHYCFLDDPRTQRVICEPNEKNEKIIKVCLAFAPLFCASVADRLDAPAVHGIDRLQAARIGDVPAQDLCTHDPREGGLLQPVSVLECLVLALHTLFAFP